MKKEMKKEKKVLKVGTKTTILVALLVYLSTCGTIVSKLFSDTATQIDRITIPLLLGLLTFSFYRLIKVAKNKQAKYMKYK